MSGVLLTIAHSRNGQPTMLATMPTSRYIKNMKTTCSETSQYLLNTMSIQHQYNGCCLPAPWVTLAPFYYYGLTLIPALTSDHIHYKNWMKLFIHFQTSTVASVTFGNGKVISPHTLMCMWLLIHAGIKVRSREIGLMLSVRVIPSQSLDISAAESLVVFLSYSKTLTPNLIIQLYCHQAVIRPERQWGNFPKCGGYVGSFSLCKWLPSPCLGSLVNHLPPENCKIRRETFKFGDLVRVISEVWW